MPGEERRPAADVSVAYWTDEAGPAWVAEEARLDAQLAPFGQPVVEALALRDGEHVLDIGCGTGALALALAEAVGNTGRVTAVDVAAPMVARARARVAEAGLASHVSVVHADAAAHPWPARGADAIASRFGLMFFSDPAAAFANLALALRPGGRLAFCCWQARERNPWFMLGVAGAREHVSFPAAPPPGAPGPFALEDPARIRALLEGAGLEAVRIDALERPLRFAGTGDEVVQHLMTIGPVGGALRAGNPVPEVRARVAAAMAAALDEIEVAGRYEAPAEAWLVRASAPGRSGRARR